METNLFTQDFSNAPRLDCFAIGGQFRSDIRQLAELYVRGFTAPPWNEQWSQEEAQKVLINYVAGNATIVIARSDSAITGFAAALPLDGYSGAGDLLALAPPGRLLYLADLVVDSKARGQGIASSLVTEIVSGAANERYAGIITRTRTDNESALRVFQKCGFNERGRYETITGGVPSLRVVLAASGRSCAARVQ